MQFEYGRFMVRVTPKQTGGYRVVIAAGGEPLIYEDRANPQQALFTGAQLIAQMAHVPAEVLIRQWVPQPIIQPEAGWQ